MITSARAASAGTPDVRPAILGALMLAFVAAVLAGARLPVIATDRDAFVALVILGWVTCMTGAGSAIQSLGWRHPITIAGSMLGFVALALIVLVVTGTTAPLASLAEAFGGSVGSATSADRVAFVGLALVLAAKWLLGIARLAAR